MWQRVERSREWFTISLRVLAVLLVPTTFAVELSESYTYVYWFCLLSGDYPILLLEPLQMVPIGFPLLLLLVIAMLPGILFSFQLARTPLNKSIRKLTGAALLLLFLLQVFQGVFAFLGSLMGVYSWLVQTLIGQSFSLTVAILIILPLMLRESVIQSCPKELLHLPLREVERYPNLGHLRNKTLTVVLWAMLVFGPFMVTSFSQITLPLAFDFVGLVHVGMYRFSVYGGASQFLSLNIYPGSILWIILLMSSIRILFVREIYRWFAKKSHRARFIMLGILAELLPSGIITTMYLLFGGMSSSVIMPFPCVLLMGLLSLKLFKFDLESTAIWDRSGGQTETWESKQQLPTKGHEESITVPLLFLARSKIEGLSSRKRKPSKRDLTEDDESLELR